MFIFDIVESKKWLHFTEKKLNTKHFRGYCIDLLSTLHKKDTKNRIKKKKKILNILKYMEEKWKNIKKK